MLAEPQWIRYPKLMSKLVYLQMKHSLQNLMRIPISEQFETGDMPALFQGLD